jgi:hypothetical protein
LGAAEFTPVPDYLEGMFDWLQQVLAEIGTPKFLVFENPDPLPFELASVDYQLFRSTFGAMKAFRVGLERYQLLLYPKPRLENFDCGQFLRIGYCDGKGIAFLRVNNCGEASPNVWEGLARKGPRDSGMRFADWLYKRFRGQRANYSVAEWQEILDGPLPFNPTEEELVRARELYRWSRIGITASDEVLINVHNGSGTSVYGLTIGVRSERLNGAVCVPINDLSQGESKEIAVDCYKSIVPPAKIELVQLPPPGPEDRAYYCEFKKVVK